MHCLLFMCHLTPFALGFSHVISDTNVIEKEIPGDVVQEQENLHMEEVGVMDGSNKRSNFIQRPGFVCHVNPKVSVDLFSLTSVS